MLIGKMICSEGSPPQLKVVNLQKEQIAIVCKLSCVHITWDTTPTYKPQVQVERLVRSRFIPARIKTTLHVHTYTLYGGGEGVVPSLSKEQFFTFLKIALLNRVTFFMPSEFRIVRKSNICIPLEWIITVCGFMYNWSALRKMTKIRSGKRS
jgi:hypothetical protein